MSCCLPAGSTSRAQQQPRAEDPAPLPLAAPWPSPLLDSRPSRHQFQLGAVGQAEAHERTLGRLQYGAAIDEVEPLARVQTHALDRGLDDLLHFRGLGEGRLEHALRRLDVEGDLLILGHLATSMRCIY